jgi:hypothetical protein
MRITALVTLAASILAAIFISSFSVQVHSQMMPPDFQFPPNSGENPMVSPRSEIPNGSAGPQMMAPGGQMSDGMAGVPSPMMPPAWFTDTKDG